jgi:adenylylsulfate kinase
VTGKSLNTNIAWHNVTVTRARREQQNGHKAIVVWFTGLSGSGKSTIAHTVEERLHRLGSRTFVFDGDNVRHGLCADLGFSAEDRHENIRRIGEMVKLFLETGVISLTAFISLYRRDREFVRHLVGEVNFLEVYCRCPVEICERRDAKGLYQRARRGEIKEFTGVSAPYEEPQSPALVLDTATMNLDQCVEAVLELLKQRHVFSQKN